MAGHRGSRLLLGVLLALTAWPAAVAHAEPRSAGRPWIMVDDDGRAAPADCGARTRTFRRIQDALGDARPGDRIAVCPGRYRESLRIGPDQHDVYLAAEVSFGAVLVPPRTDARPAVDIQGVTSFEMRGFRIRPAGRTGPLTVGGLRIAGTRVCSPAPVAIRIEDATDVTIRGMRIGAAPGCGYRTGIEVARSSAVIRYDEVTDFLSRGIVAHTGSHVTIDTTAVRFLHTRRDRALPGATLDGEATGVFIDGAATARFRTISVFTRLPDAEDELPTLLWAGIDIVDTPGSVSIRGKSVVTRTWRYGIRVRRTGEVTIFDTLVRDTFGDGYYLDGVSGGRVVDSDSERNPTGIRLGPETTDMLVSGFLATASVIMDCVDMSSGDRTAGTANTWRRATGDASVPDGICTAPTP
jgi:hypothetical protein